MNTDTTEIFKYSVLIGWTREEYKMCLRWCYSHGMTLMDFMHRENGTDHYFVFANKEDALLFKLACGRHG